MDPEPDMLARAKELARASHDRANIT